MPIYNFLCLDCKKEYEKLVKSFDATEKYEGVLCPFCNSANKEKRVSSFAFTFANPEGTDKWNASHDYRFYHKLPKARSEREAAQKAQKHKYNAVDDISSGKHFGDVK